MAPLFKTIEGLACSKIGIGYTHFHSHVDILRLQINNVQLYVNYIFNLQWGAT